MYRNKVLALVCVLLFAIGCKQHPNKQKETTKPKLNYLYNTANVLNYKGVPVNKKDRNALMFSDQGAWFAYGLPDGRGNGNGFSGPFLLTQQNGVWAGRSLSELTLVNGESDTLVDWQEDLIDQSSYHSHLEQTFENKRLRVEQQLVYMSAHTALQRTKITNLSNQSIALGIEITGNVFDSLDINVLKEKGGIKLVSDRSEATGHLKLLNKNNEIKTTGNTFSIKQTPFVLQPKETKEVIMAQSFIFPEYSWKEEEELIDEADFESVLLKRKIEKEGQLESLIDKQRTGFKKQEYTNVLAKALLTLQNNWRVPAGELKHQGLFPSYHYKWFHGFWSWDSWKHAVGLVLYNEDLAKDQIRAMFDFQQEDGFIVDCIYRDTTIEAHNYRDTKPPLASWAVAEVFGKSGDTAFVKEMYSKLKRYHEWWYAKRDHDKDGLCEYGSTDGSLIAAKWESGMDNAIRFDDAEILKNSDGAYSLNQESVDLNAYLYAEKLYLAALANVLHNETDKKDFEDDAQQLKDRIQHQFYSEEDGWFYDTSLDGEHFVKGAGSEGWIPLWTNVATPTQAEAIKNKMMNTEKFFTKVPFQTMAKDHPKFDPMNGYWRGPNWLDQAYFGVKGLRNYGYNKEADSATVQILNGAEGLLDKGTSIRENYHPITGKGLNAKNFSWSAAHIMMMLTEDN
ncbi:trehalase [Zhouia spongiae]|uniref:Trehalase n=1 Tax=Zhouia spongiae TaxID=2202721 RepID=A0ABY3YPT7_9FLAO|nr:trehalase family glycosidase [Zhouia spongiae]UNY99807.1 trehalase [Zhouia spongiae]